MHRHNRWNGLAPVRLNPKIYRGLSFVRFAVHTIDKVQDLYKGKDIHRARRPSAANKTRKKRSLIANLPRHRVSVCSHFEKSFHITIHLTTQLASIPG